jgi:tRNA(Ile)-lysidine synthase
MKKKLVIGVSGGPDSMFCLEMIRQNPQQEAIVAHVNYEKDFIDEQIVKEYCLKHSIKLEIKIIESKPSQINFQS